MSDISNIMGNITILLAVFGGGLAAVSIAYCGIQWMLSSGDPQKMAQVRMGVIGAVGGLVLVGVAFIIPRVVSQLVIEPSGGVAFDWDVGFNCDQVLRDQLVVHRAASDVARINAVIGQVQSQRDECSSDIWHPEAKRVTRFVGPHCFRAQGMAFTGFANLPLVSRLKVGSSVVPRSLRVPQPGNTGLWGIRWSSGRDSQNNILVHWHSGESANADLPADSSKCWLYVSRLGVWSENY